MANRLSPIVCTNNDRMSEAIKKYPDMFSGIAGIDHRDIRKAVAETERGMKYLGINGPNSVFGNAEKIFRRKEKGR